MRQKNRLRALVAKRDWNEVEEIAKNRKSPIGWEVRKVQTYITNPPIIIIFPQNPKLTIEKTTPQPFFNLVLQAGNARLASVFVPKCTNLEPGAAVTMYEKCGMRVKAAEEAVKAKDADAWMRLLEAAGKTTPEGREIDKLGAQVFKK